MWIVQKKVNDKWVMKVNNIPDEKTATEWIQMLQRHHPDDEFRPCEKISDNEILCS